MTDRDELFKEVVEVARAFLDADKWLVRLKNPDNFDRKRKAREKLEAALAKVDANSEEEG